MIPLDIECRWLYSRNAFVVCVTYIEKKFSIAKWKRGDNNDNNNKTTNTGTRDDDSSSKNMVQLDI